MVDEMLYEGVYIKLMDINLWLLIYGSLHFVLIAKILYGMFVDIAT